MSAWVRARRATDRDLECVSAKRKANAWIYARRRTDRDPAGVIPDKKKRKSVIFAIACGHNVFGMNNLCNKISACFFHLLNSCGKNVGLTPHQVKVPYVKIVRLATQSRILSRSATCPSTTNLLKQLVGGVDTEKSLWTAALVNQLRIRRMAECRFETVKGLSERTPIRGLWR